MFLPLVVVAASLLAAAPVLGQATGTVPSLPAAEDAHVTFRSSVDLVTLNVTVTDGQDQHLSGLGRGDFEVLEDGVPQSMSFFAANQVPLDVALLIDTSASMREKLATVEQAADRFLNTLRTADRGEIVGFNSQTRVLQPFTSDVRLLRAAVHRAVAGGETALYTALYITLDQFLRSKGSATDVRRPAVILLTDGQDTGSLIQFDDVLERARRAGVAIYAISIVSPSEAAAEQGDGGRRFLGNSDYALKELAKETGGRAFFPMQLADLDGVYESVANELSTQYALGYIPRSRGVAGAFRRVAVRVPTHPGAHLRTRAGYYAPTAAAALEAPTSR